MGGGELKRKLSSGNSSKGEELNSATWGQVCAPARTPPTGTEITTADLRVIWFYKKTT